MELRAGLSYVKLLHFARIKSISSALYIVPAAVSEADTLYVYCPCINQIWARME